MELHAPNAREAEPRSTGIFHWRPLMANVGGSTSATYRINARHNTTCWNTKQMSLDALALQLSDRPCSKCGGMQFGLWTSSSSGRTFRYCVQCRNERRKAYNARKIANGGSHTRAQWLEILMRTDCCPRCGRQWNEIPPRPNKRYKTTWTKDHIVPLSHGGTDDITNIQPLCYQCQFRKNAGA